MLYARRGHPSSAWGAAQRLPATSWRSGAEPPGGSDPSLRERLRALLAAALALPAVKFLRRHRLLSGAAIVVLLFALIGVIGAAVLMSGPLPHVAAPESSKLLAIDGSVIATLHGTQDRTIVPLDDMSANLRAAVVSAEDRNFYHEGAVSLPGTLRALFTDVAAGSPAQGGSTLTQQYVRNAFAQVGRQRTLGRKLKELALAEKLDRAYSKDKILELYLNTVYFGRGAYGGEAAARAYFGKSAKDLTLAESTYLAGILRSPESYQPDLNPAGVTSIRAVVLSGMRRDNVVNQAEADAAQSQQLDFSHGATSALTSRAAYFTEYVRRFLKDQVHLSDKDLLTGGLQVSTTLDLKMQAAAERAVSSTLDQASDPEAALVAMDTNGNVRAMVGGRDLTNLARAQGFNFAYQRSGATGGRQAGSAFKPFTLAALLKAGHPITMQLDGPPTIDIPSAQCRNQDGSAWHVSNFAKESFGSLDITAATAHSVNTVYAQLVDLLGPKKVKEMAQQVGGWNNLLAVCSITLGTSPVTPLEMARAYSTFAARGQRPVPLAVTKVVSVDGRTLFEQAPHHDQVLDPAIADTVNQVLTSVLDYGTAHGKGIGRPAAGKTGTTENQTDAWFIGYTPGLTAAVWMGFPPDPKTGQTPTMSNVRGGPVTGGLFPATIWNKFMSEAVAGTPPTAFVSPSAIVIPAGSGGDTGTGAQACGSGGAPACSAQPRPAPVVVAGGPPPCSAVGPMDGIPGCGTLPNGADPPGPSTSGQEPVAPAPPPPAPVPPANGLAGLVGGLFGGPKRAAPAAAPP